MRILLVEDDQPLVRIITKSLDQSGFDVDVATDGEDGLHKARSGGYDSVVLDLQLPKMSGVEVCKTLRDERNDVPILMLTARSGVSDRIAGLDAGADDYLPKPFSLGELAARLRALGRRGRSDEPEVLEAEGLVLDTGAREVRVGETPVELTGTEFELLAMLARAPQKVFHRDEILNRLRGQDADLYTRAVDILVSRLRKKLEPLDCIKTLRNAGYALAVARSEPS